MPAKKRTATHTKHAKMTPDLHQRIVRAYTTEKLSIRAIAADIGCSYGGVHRVLHLHGVPRRPRGPAGRHGTGEAQ